MWCCTDDYRFRFYRPHQEEPDQFTWIVQTNHAGLQLSPGRLSGVFSALSSLMEFLEFNDEIDTNPVPSFRKRYLTPYKRQGGVELPRFCPTTEQVRTVVSLAPDSRDKAIHILFAKTGLRKKELRALDVDDINLVEKYVMAKPSAKRTGRKLPLDDECCLFLAEWFMTVGFSRMLHLKPLYS